MENLKVVGLSRGAVKLCVILVALSGCGSTYTNSAPNVSSNSPGGELSLARRPQKGSWMDSSARGQDLLYVSNVENNYDSSVYAYSYPQGQLVGTLTGFISPFGECIDAVGDVFIVDQANKSSGGTTIYEYAHGGTAPIATLSDPSTGLGCAIDPTTGSLAVSGSAVAIYAHASGKPTMYYWSESYFFYCGYDNKSNLYLTAPDQSSGGSEALLVRLSKSGAFDVLNVNTTLYYSSYPTTYPSVQWDGGHLIVSSAQYIRRKDPRPVYRLRIKGNDAILEGTTNLATSKNLFSGETWIQRSAIIGAFATKGLERWGLSSWQYPSGGSRHTIAEHGGAQNLQAIVVSPAARPAAVNVQSSTAL
jgi:hypothetical protein